MSGNLFAAMMTIHDWLIHATRRLKDSGINSARLDALLLLERELAHGRAWLQAHDDFKLSSKQCQTLDAMLLRRTKREPLAYILAQREFMGLNFRVNSAVLTPRPETEVLVEAGIERIPKNARVLELGTGSGCIAVSLAYHRPDVILTATDVSEAALEVARRNAKQHGADIEFIKSDLFEEVKQTYDTILTNLPYVPDGTRRQPEITYEPDIALYGGADGLDLYRQFFRQLPSHVHQNAIIIFEASPTQHAELVKLSQPLNKTLSMLSEYIYLLD